MEKKFQEGLNDINNKLLGEKKKKINLEYKENILSFLITEKLKKVEIKEIDNIPDSNNITWINLINADMHWSKPLHEDIANHMKIMGYNPEWNDLINSLFP